MTGSCMNQQQFSKSMVVNGRINAPDLIPSWYKRKWHARLSDKEADAFVTTGSKWPAKNDCDFEKSNSMLHVVGRNDKVIGVYLTDAGAEDLFVSWRNYFATRLY